MPPSFGCLSIGRKCVWFYLLVYFSVGVVGAAWHGSLCKRQHQTITCTSICESFIAKVLDPREVQVYFQLGSCWLANQNVQSHLNCRTPQLLFEEAENKPLCIFSPYWLLYYLLTLIVHLTQPNLTQLGLTSLHFTVFMFTSLLISTPSSQVIWTST